MKKLFYLFLVITIISCGGDDDNSTSSIEGRWNLTSEKRNGIDLNLSSCNLQSYMILSENGSGLLYAYDVDDDSPNETCVLINTINVSSTYITNNSFSMTWYYSTNSIEEGTAEVNNNILIFSSLFEEDNYETVFSKE